MEKPLLTKLTEAYSQRQQESQPTESVKPARKEKAKPAVKAANGHKRKLTVYIPEELAEQLRAHCFHHRLKYSAAVEQALTRLVKRT